jgi:glyceraldehyde 3-phosphate dehydrogenase
MTIKVGINGFGRIGRIVFRAAQERSDIEIVGINDLLDAEYMAYMLKYDSTHGRFNGTVEVKDGHLVVNGKTIRVTAEKDPANLKWNEIGVDVVAEATGIFLTDETARKHITAGAKKVVLTGPSKDNTPMFVKGANFEKYAGQDIVSNASCTTNCLAPPFTQLPLLRKLLMARLTKTGAAAVAQLRTSSHLLPVLLKL